MSHPAIDDGPVRLGTMLFTIVEPHEGHEVAYNRWYERDHYYAGCMVGAHTFAARRWVAPWTHKRLRWTGDGEIADDPATGSYLATYYVLDGHHEEWTRWAYREVKRLHADGRMFAERDHVHTLMYRYAWGAARDPDGVPVALSLDHPFGGLVAVLGEADGDEAPTADDWRASGVLPVGDADAATALMLAFEPLPLMVDAPGVERDEGGGGRFLHLHLVDRDPLEAWDEEFAALPQRAADAGLGRVTWMGPFIPTIPGTDTYTDELRPPR